MIKWIIDILFGAILYGFILTVDDISEKYFKKIRKRNKEYKDKFYISYEEINKLKRSE